MPHKIEEHIFNGVIEWNFKSFGASRCLEVFGGWQFGISNHSKMIIRKMGAFYDESVEVIAFSISHFSYHLSKMIWFQILNNISYQIHFNFDLHKKKIKVLRHPIYHDLITNVIRYYLQLLAHSLMVWNHEKLFWPFHFLLQRWVWWACSFFKEFVTKLVGRMCPSLR